MGIDMGAWPPGRVGASIGVGPCCICEWSTGIVESGGVWDGICMEPWSMGIVMPCLLG